jgi:hypothetical protein
VAFHELKAIDVKMTIVEPGGFRTDWAGALMTFTESDEYVQAHFLLRYLPSQRYSRHRILNPKFRQISRQSQITSVFQSRTSMRKNAGIKRHLI